MTKVEVLDGQGFVELIDSMGDDSSVTTSARVSYANDQKQHSAQRDEKLIRYLLRNHHTSPFEAVRFTFHVSAPIFVVRQWARHRTWSYLSMNEISARYTELPGYVYHPTNWRGQSSDNKQMSDGLIENQEAAHGVYSHAVDEAYMAYRQLLDLGVSRELARMVLPVSAFTRFYASVDLNNLFKFLSLRDHEHAQPEIVEYARAMKEIVKPIVPVSMAAWEEIR